MDALTQYTDLYSQYRDRLREGFPEAFNRARDAACDALLAAGRFPRRGDEGYPLVSPEDLLAPDYALNILRRPMDVTPAAFACAQPGLGAHTVLMMGDTFVTAPESAPLPDGVEVMSFARAAAICPGLIAGDGCEVADPVVALNTMLVQDGVFIRVREGVRCERPIQILNSFPPGAPWMAVRRVRIVLEHGAHITVLNCDHPRRSTHDTLSCRVTDISLAEDASLDLYDLEEDTARNNRLAYVGADQARASRLNSCSVFISGHVTRNRYNVRHSGTECLTELGGLVIGAAGQQVDNSTYIAHEMPRCTSRQLFKYALFDDSRGAYEGTVQVDHGAVLTDARQTNRNLLGSPQAKMHAMPQLIIDCDDVKASHGAATGQLDERALFYMRSRGIPLDEARTMLTRAFLTDVLDSIRPDSLRESLTSLVDKRLRGAGSTCDNCSLDHDLRH